MDYGVECYRRFLSGDTGAFDELMLQYHDALIFFIYKIVGNMASAEDLAADTFMDLLVHKHRFAFRSSFKTYLFSVARHKSIDYIRKERHTDADALVSESETADAVGIEARVLQKERDKIIGSAIASLCPDYRSVLILSYFEDMETDDIARVMNKSKKQVGNLLYRAKNALKTNLQKEGITDEN